MKGMNGESMNGESMIDADNVMTKDRRERVMFTTYPELIRHVHDERGFMSFSEYVHRLLVKDYNEKHPDRKIKVWEPEGK